MVSKILSFILLISILPILLVISIAIFLDDGFPIMFRQKRVGKDNKYFWIYKFRTMKKDTKDIPTHLVKNSSSIYTLLGPFFRKFSLDELPQLINIIKGEMTFIGPRPALHNQYDLIELRTNKGVHKLLPGVTGWAQVNGRDELSIQEKVDLDNYYKKNKSTFLNIKIGYITILKVFKAESVTI